MTKTKGFSQHDATVATIIGNCVCIASFELSSSGLRFHRVLLRKSLFVEAWGESSPEDRGGGIAGFVSQYIGRRLTIM